MECIVNVDLPQRPEAAALARRAIALADDKIPPAAMQDIQLLVSELVTNAVRHAPIRLGRSIKLALLIDGCRVRVEVTDPGKGFTPLTQAVPSGGWGLRIVEQLSDRWGVGSGGSTMVWFEIDADDPVEHASDGSESLHGMRSA